ncbi:Rep family protein [Streptococcus merionis]|uniref:Rep family protein n=1 Tax=Streptococcus merionis TaxID=400065 RepID=UPI003F80B2AD
MMYTQQVRLLKHHDWKKETRRIVDAGQPKHWAAILHDKDISEDGKAVEPHLHLMLYFPNARSPKSVAWEINDKEGLREEANTERLEFFKNPNNGYSYLVHRTANALDKYQYPLEAVISNFDYPAKMEQITKNVKRRENMKEGELINEFLDLLYANEITLEEVEEILTGSQYAKAAALIKKVMEKKQEKVIKAFIKEMEESHSRKEIIYIYGQSGTGKTRLAIDYADKASEDYFITGSSKDPFQDYNNEAIVIMDELRPETFSYDDLLKILDPYNFNVMLPVRFYDKALTAKTIFITSPYSPYELYKEMFLRKKANQQIDTFSQLKRRLNVTIYLDEDAIYLTEFDGALKQYLPIDTSKESNPFYEMSLSQKNDQDMYAKIIQSVKTIRTAETRSLPDE